MTRFKWYKIAVPSGLNRFIGRVKSARFTAETNAGFLPLPDTVMGCLDFRFLWRSSIVTVGFDDFGNQIRNVFNNVEQISVRFLRSGDRLFIRIVDPPRTTRELFNMLEFAAEGGISVEHHVFSSKDQSIILKKFDSYRLVGIRGTGSSVEHRFVARVELASKDGIQLDRLKFLQKLQFSADHSSYEVMEDGFVGQLTFMRTGLVRVGGAILPYVVAQLEQLLMDGESNEGGGEF